MAMEHPTKYDFFLNFKAIYNEKNEFVDYLLLDVSNNFKNIFGIKAEFLIGKKISEIVALDDNINYGIRDIYYYMIPNTRRKFEKYFEDIGRWYFINIISDEKDYLLLFFTDITKIKQETKKQDINNLKHNDKSICFMDRLTGLYNRYFFDIELSRLDTKRQLPISIIIGDLNGLKLINDAFGHKMGDLAIKAVANIMKRAVRKEDIVSRFGGDEFFILLPNTTEDTAKAIVRRMQEDCNNNTIEYIKLSISFGLATKTIYDENIFDIMKKAEDRMYHNKLTESKEAKLNIVKYVKQRLEDLSLETKEHYKRLEHYSLMLAEQLGLSDMEKEKLKLLCEFHDIGKIGVSPDILNKQEKLTQEEWEQIKRHSEIGYHIVNSTRDAFGVDELILMHHEKWDGSGYPGLIRKEEIPITVRVFAVADAYEAMVNDRPYKDKISKDDAIKEIRRQAGIQFDPYIAEVFANLMSDDEIAI